ncbi:MAG TPA: DUF4340 domain-containing protein [Polyangiaceae bacterium]|nr:DUF4340 domain-containing protein [Polyangiaceae bacterium]
MRPDRSAFVNVALIVLAIASTVALVFSREMPTTAELDQRARNVFPLFSRERLESILIESGKGTLRLERARAGDSPRRWLLDGDAAQEADPEAVTGLVRALELLPLLRRLDAEQADRAALGLEPPRARVRLVFDGVEGELVIGKTAATPSDAAYVEVRGFGRPAPALGLVRSALLDEIVVAPDAVRPRWLVPYALSDLARIRVRAGGKDLALEHAKGPSFHAPSGRRVPRAALERLVLELSRARAERLLGLDAAKSALGAEPAVTAGFVPRDGRPTAELEVGGACPGAPELVVAVRKGPNPAAYCVGAGVRDLFTKLPDVLEDTAPFVLRADEVEVVTVERDGRRIELARSESGFTLRGAATAAVDLDTGNRFLESLLEARGDVAPQPNPAALGLEPAAGSVQLRSSTIEGAEKFEETVEIGRPLAGGRLALRRKDDGAVLIVPEQAARAFSLEPSLLRSRRLLDFVPSELERLTLESAGLEQVLRRTGDGSFQLERPRGLEHDAGLVLDLVQALGTLTADRWVATTDSGGHGLENPHARLRLELVPREGRPRSIELRIGNETLGGYFATMDTKPGVFVLPKPFVRDATTPLLSRGVFIRDPRELARLELDLEGRRVALERAGGTFVARGTELADALIERLVANATSLRAEGALSVGEPRPEEGLSRPRITLRFHPLPGKGSPETLRVGAEATFRGVTVFAARIDGVQATYGVPAGLVRDLLESL